MKLYHPTTLIKADKIQANGFCDYEHPHPYPDGVIFLRNPDDHPDQGKERDAVFIVEFPIPDEIAPYIILEGKSEEKKMVCTMWIIPSKIANKYFTDKTVYDLYADFEQ